MTLFDVAAAEALHCAQSDPDAAAKALTIAADYLRQGKELPIDLRYFLANAITTAMAQRPGKRGPTLLEELHLKSKGRRPVKRKWLDDPGAAMYWLIEGGESQNEASSQTAADYGISESTAIRLYREFRIGKE